MTRYRVSWVMEVAPARRFWEIKRRIPTQAEVEAISPRDAAWQASRLSLTEYEHELPDGSWEFERIGSWLRVRVEELKQGGSPSETK